MSTKADSQLFEIRLYRAFTDPIVVHEPTIGFAESVPAHVIESVRVARVGRQLGRSLDDVITRATVPETVAYCYVASFDARCATNPEFHAVYQAAFHDYIEEFQEMSVADLPDGLREPRMAPGIDDASSKRPAYISATGKDRYTGLREWIVEQQDRAFIESGGLYDRQFAESSVSKARWSGKQRSVSAETPDWAQSGLGDFADDS